MNVRLVPEFFNVAGDRAFFVEGYTGDNWLTEWELNSAPLLDNGRPDMTRVTKVDMNFDWTDTPWEGKVVTVEDILNLMYWMGGLQRAHKMLPGVFY